MKVLALNINGDLTYCTSPVELRGSGRCNHVDHQGENETIDEFMSRLDESREESTYMGKVERTAFIPYDGASIETLPYRMTEEEKEDLLKIESRVQLDKDMDGGYIPLDEPLWNDMDKSYFAQKSGMHKGSISKVLKEEAYIILESDKPRYPPGRVIDEEDMEELKAEYPDMVIETGVSAMNAYARDSYDWEATRDIYVLPYYMRLGSADVDSDLTIGYKYLFYNRKNPNKQQLAYEALLNNSSLTQEQSRYNGKYRQKSLADEFAGKSGIFRAAMSGSSIPHSGRAVITPSTEANFGEIMVPPSMAVDIFRPTLLEQMSNEGKSIEDIDNYFRAFRVPQDEVPEDLRMDLERRVGSRRVGMNRQPSLHFSSFQSFRPRISPDASVKINQLYCDAYGADFDGDETTIYGFNQDNIIDIVNRNIAAENPINTQKPRNQESSTIMPPKDSLFGLLNILNRRTV